MKKKFELRNFHTIVLDFDGVFTDNKVFVDSKGFEYVRCDRSDSLGLNLLKKFISKKKYNIDLVILSTEKNDVVLSRAKKLKLDCFNGVDDKKAFLESFLKKKNVNKHNFFNGLIYLGNDLNDLSVMENAGFSVAPNDAHELIKKVSDRVSIKNGGDGFIRDFVEFAINLHKLNKEEICELISYS